MSRPAHADQHDELIEILAKMVEKCKLIEYVVMVTIGFDGRPVVGGNLDDSSQISDLFRQLVAAEDKISESYKIAISSDN